MEEEEEEEEGQREAGREVRIRVYLAAVTSLPAGGCHWLPILASIVARLYS